MSDWDQTCRLMEAGDKVCQTCFNTLPDLMQTCLDVEPVLVVTPDSENHQLPSLDEQIRKESAKEELNRVFQAVSMKPIRDEYVYCDFFKTCQHVSVGEE